MSFTDVIDWAKKLGGLEASAIWALVCAWFAWRSWTSDKHHEEYNKAWQEIRIKDSIAELKMATAVEVNNAEIRRLAERVEEHCDQTAEIRIILDERIPKGESGHVRVVKTTAPETDQK